MRKKILMRLLTALALLLLAFPAVGLSQDYDRAYDRDRYSRADRRDVHNVIVRLDNSSAQLERDLKTVRERRVMGQLWAAEKDKSAITDVRDFRRAVSRLKKASDNGRELRRSYEEAAMVIDRGAELDRYLRLRTGSTMIDADLSELRSNLHMIAELYNLSTPY